MSKRYSDIVPQIMERHLGDHPPAPRDHEALKDWYDEGYRPEDVEEGVREAAEKARKRGEAPPKLWSYYTDAIEEAHKRRRQLQAAEGGRQDVRGAGGEDEPLLARYRKAAEQATNEIRKAVEEGQLEAAVLEEAGPILAKAADAVEQAATLSEAEDALGPFRRDLCAKAKEAALGELAAQIEQALEDPRATVSSAVGYALTKGRGRPALRLSLVL